MLAITGNRPVPGVLFGITHDLQGGSIIREPRILKVGIGQPRGRAFYCFIHNDRKWYFRMGKKGGDGKFTWQTSAPLATRKEAEAFYRENFKKADIINYPQKLGYFTFTKPAIQDDGTEVFEPDFGAIEANGPMPREIDIVFLNDNPFEGAYQMWTSSELKCKGDGLVAMRLVSMAREQTATEEERAAAFDAEAAGDKYFPILNNCWNGGCRFSKEVMVNGKPQPSPCKPGADVKFQLAMNIRVGGTAYFHTSGYRSISQIWSSLEQIKTLTGGRLAGVPLKMMLRPYKTKHNGQSATQFGVSLEFRAEDVQALRKNLMAQALQFREALGPAPPYPDTRLIANQGLPAAAESEEEDDDHPLGAAAMTDEFYASEEDGEPEPGQQQPAGASSQGAATATETRTQNLSDKLSQEKQKKQPDQGDPKGRKEGDVF